MNVKTLGGFPPDSNPFNHDLYHMGTEIGVGNPIEQRFEHIIKENSDA